MTQYAMIDELTKKVANIFDKPMNPVAGHIFVSSDEWEYPDNQIYSGMRWVNWPIRPASFEWVAADPGEDILTLEAARELRNRGMADVAKANTAMDRILA